MSLCLLNAASCVEQTGEFPEQQFEEPAPAPVPATDDALQLRADELRRIPVLVTVFQGLSLQRTLWVAVDEDLESFVARANVLVNPDPAFLDLVPASPQPDTAFFVFIYWCSNGGWRCTFAHCYVTSSPPVPLRSRMQRLRRRIWKLPCHMQFLR